MKYKNYTIETEEIYNKTYQINEYRGIILDENSCIVEECAKKYKNSSAAIEDAKDLVDKKYSKDSENIFSPSVKKVWIAKNASNYIKIVLCVIVVILFWVLLFILFGDIVTLFIPIALVIVLPIIAIFSIRKQVTSFGSFIYDNGLYLVMLNNSNAWKANLLSRQGSSGLGAIYAIGGLLDNQRYLNHVTGINDIVKLSEKTVIWKFTDVKNIIKLNDNLYKIDAQYIDFKNDKTKRISFKLRNRYDDFDDLVRTLMRIKDRR